VNDPLEARTVTPDQETVQQVNLGDSRADNERLTNAMKQLATTVGTHSDNRARLVGLLKSIGGHAWWAAAFAVSPLRWAIEVFVGHEEKILRAQADAEKVKAEAAKLRAQASVEAQLAVLKGQADATKTLAEADKLRAEAEKIRAEATALEAKAEAKAFEADRVQAKVGRADDMAVLLKMMGVQWTTEEENGVFKIIVVKDSVPDLTVDDEDDAPPTEALPPHK
jgi:hypothetical protein